MNPPMVASYEKILTAIGRLIDQQKWAQVCVVELEGGIMVQGMAIVPTTDAYAAEMRTKVYDPDALRQLMSSMGIR
jgi:hypothetical protein